MTIDEMRVRPEDYDLDYETGIPIDMDDDFECDFCDDRGCEECHPDDFAQMHLKWTCDSTGTIDEAITALQEFISDLREYQSNGFELSEPVDNAYFFLERVNQGKS